MRGLRLNPRQDQEAAAQAILPISLKLGQFNGVHLRRFQSKFEEMWSKPRGVDYPILFCITTNFQCLLYPRQHLYYNALMWQ